MEVMTPRVRSLLRQARRTEESNKRTAATHLYRQVLDEAPQAVEAWLGLARLSDDPGEQKAAYERALELDPEKVAALKKMDQEPAPVEAPRQKTGREQPQPASSGAGVNHGQAARREKPAARPRPAQPARPAEKPVAQVGSEEAVEATAGEAVCYRHPDKATRLRCYSCSKPICIKCAKRTPVGYRCPQCVRDLEDAFFNASPMSYLIAASVALILGIIGGVIASFFGFFIIFIGPGIGTLIGRLAFRATGRRHGRWLPHLVGGLVALGGLATVLFGGSLLWMGVYAFLAAGAAYYQVK